MFVNQGGEGVLPGHLRIGFLILAAGSLAGCESMNWKSPDDYFAHMRVSPPKEKKLSVCHGYGCKYRTKVTFSSSDIDDISSVLKPKTKEDSAAAERKRIANAVALIERKVGKVVGSDKDKGQLQLKMAGKPGQQDCVDEATNTTSYLIMMQQEGLLKHHKVKKPSGRGFFLDGRWQHFSAVVEDKNNQTDWVIDSWPRDNGKLPVVLPLKTWMKDYDNYKDS